MDGHRFDNLLRELIKSRRSLLGAGLAGLLGVSATDARLYAKGKGKKKKRKKGCRQDSDCASGLNCDINSGQCVCRQGGRCDGCCSGNSCVPASSQSTEVCGLGGKACESCNPNVRCDTGQGKCVCDKDSCFGCCTEDRKRCRSGSDKDACGKDGNICDQCAQNEECTGQECVAESACGQGQDDCGGGLCCSSGTCCGQQCCDFPGCCT